MSEPVTYDRKDQYQQVASGLTYEVELRGVEKTHHVHNVILHYAAAGK